MYLFSLHAPTGSSNFSTPMSIPHLALSPLSGSWKPSEQDGFVLQYKVPKGGGNPVRWKWKLEVKVRPRKWEDGSWEPQSCIGISCMHEEGKKTSCGARVRFATPWVLGPSCSAEWNTKRGCLGDALHFSQAIDRRSSERDRQTVTGKMNCHLPFFRGTGDELQP